MFIVKKIFQIGRLEQNLQQLQLNLASSHQRHKTEMQRLDDQVRHLEHDLSDAHKHCNGLTQEVARKDDIIKRNEGDIKSAKDDISAKVDEVRHGNQAFWLLLTKDCIFWMLTEYG